VSLSRQTHAWLKDMAKANERIMIREVAAQLNRCRERDEATLAPRNYTAY
jgi:hypothetical protein